MSIDEQNSKLAFETSDFLLASCLLSLGFYLIRLNSENPKRVVFCFKSATKLHSAVESFWSRELRLDPFLLFENLKHLKCRLREELNKGAAYVE